MIKCGWCEAVRMDLGSGKRRYCFLEIEREATWTHGSNVWAASVSLSILVLQENTNLLSVSTPGSHSKGCIRDGWIPPLFLPSSSSSAACLGRLLRRPDMQNWRIKTCDKVVMHLKRVETAFSSWNQGRKSILIIRFHLKVLFGF